MSSERTAAPHHETRLEHAEHALAEASNALLHTLEDLLKVPEPAASRWHRGGVSRRGERVFNVISALVLLLFGSGWAWSIANAGSVDEDAAPESPVTAVATALTGFTRPDAPTAAYLTDAALEALTPLRGTSGRLRAAIRPAGEPVIDQPLPGGATLDLRTDSLRRDNTGSSGAAGDSVRTATGAARESTAAGPPAPGTPSPAPAVAPRPGIWQLALRLGGQVRPVDSLNVISMTPFSAKRGGRIGLYFIGSWPTEGRRDARRGYAPPRGFIEVTPDNQNTELSEHFRLRDFLTHDQQNVWPKYVVVDTRLLDKLELILAELRQRGIDTRGTRVMSGFRTPQYNAGGGDPRGRAGLSRHMYGDAADIFIDSDGDGSMDDLNHDGRVNINDARMIDAAADRVERAHPELMGGVGVYPGNAAHGPFTHIDTRGFRARWVGTGDGG